MIKLHVPRLYRNIHSSFFQHVCDRNISFFKLAIIFLILWPSNPLELKCKNLIIMHIRKIMS